MPPLRSTVRQSSRTIRRLVPLLMMACSRVFELADAPGCRAARSGASRRQPRSLRPSAMPGISSYGRRGDGSATVMILDAPGAPVPASFRPRSSVACSRCGSLVSTFRCRPGWGSSRSPGIDVNAVTGIEAVREAQPAVTGTHDENHEQFQQAVVDRRDVVEPRIVKIVSQRAMQAPGGRQSRLPGAFKFVPRNGLRPCAYCPQRL